MTRDQAEQVFSLIADLHGELRDRLVTSRWWLIWGVMGFQTLAACAASHALRLARPEAVWPHVGVWTAHVLMILLLVRLVHRRVGGQRTAREGLLWSIWLTFLAAASSLAGLNALLGLDPFRLLPVAGLLAAFACALTATCVHPLFWLGGGLFAAAAVAMALLPGVQFLIYGAAWLVCLETVALALRPRLSTEATAL